MSAISSCPKCTRLVTLPQGADPEAQVRCPMCHGEYRLADAMAGMPPELMLVGAAANAADAALRDTMAFSPSTTGAGRTAPVAAPLGDELPAMGDDLATSGPDFSSLDLNDDRPSDEIDFGEPAIDLPDFEAGEADGLKGVNATGTAPLGGQDFFRDAPTFEEDIELDDSEPTELDIPKNDPNLTRGKNFDFGKSGKGGGGSAYPTGIKPAPSRRRRESSGIGNLIGIVLGGVVGLGLGYLALLWIGGPDKDFAKAGDMLPSWMLPASFQKTKAQASRPVVPTPDMSEDLETPTEGELPVNVPEAGDENTAASEALDSAATAATDNSAGALDPMTADSADSTATDATASTDPTTPSAFDEDPLNTAAVPGAEATSDDPFAEAPATTTDNAGTTAAEDPFAAPTAEPTEKATETVAEKPVADAADDPFASPAANAGTALEMPAENAADPFGAGDQPTTDAATSEKPMTEPSGDDPFATPATETQPETSAADATTTDKSSVEAPATDASDATAAEDVPAPMQPKLALVQPTSYTGQDVSGALAKVNQVAETLRAPESLSKDDLRKARNQFYLNFYRLAEVATHTANATSKNDLSQLMLAAASDEKKITEIGKAGDKWIGLPQRGEQQGVLITGTVESLEKNPAGFAFALRVDPAKEPLIVLSPSDPGTADGERIVLAGSIIDRPKQNITGYGGPDQPVVWLGHLEKLPAATE